MSDINKPVYQFWSRTLRFGRIAEEKKEGLWKYYKVNWVDDEAHEQAISSMLKLRRDEYDPSHEWHRTDKVNFFEPEELVSRINKLEVK